MHERCDDEISEDELDDAVWVEDEDGTVGYVCPDCAGVVIDPEARSRALEGWIAQAAEREQRGGGQQR